MALSAAILLSAALAAAAPAGGAAPAAGPKRAAKGGAVEQELVAFLYPSREQAKDGSASGSWDGPGGSQLRMSHEYLERRNEQLANADMLTQAIVQAVRSFYDDPSERPPREVRENLLKMGGMLDEVRDALKAAVEQEAKRLSWVQKASEAGGAGYIPHLDPELVKRRLAAIQSGRLNEAAEARVRGFQSFVTGIVAYIDGDPLAALEKMKGAARDAPDIALAHAYLGSLYYVFNQPQLALQEWRRTLELDPTNEAVKQALQEHAGEAR